MRSQLANLHGKKLEEASAALKKMISEYQGDRNDFLCDGEQGKEKVNILSGVIAELQSLWAGLELRIRHESEVVSEKNLRR